MTRHDPMEPLSRRDRERARHRREILAAAKRLFARKGYRSTTVEEIAREAQFAVGTLYLLFKDKDDLCVRLIEASVREFLNRFEREVLPLKCPEQAIASLIKLRLTDYHEHREFVRSAMEAMPALRMAPISALPEALAQSYQRYIQAVGDIFRRGMAQGLFVRSDPHFLALCLEGTLNAFVADWCLQEPDEPLGLLIGNIKRQFLTQLKLRPDLDDGE